jgi:dihydropteroate synthase
VGEAAIFPRSRVTIVGVLNVTPDSFSDGGRFPDADSAIDAALAMARDGAHVIDVGGESTRPGARAVPADEEIARVVPVIEALAKATSLPISIDTRKAAVARAALEAGARVVNDVSGGRFDRGLLAAAAEFGATLVLGHLRGVPETMQDAPHFEDVLAEVADELADAARRARAAGVPAERLVFDPGIGFGKGLADNLALLAEPGWLAARLGGPVLVGPSRKSFLGRLTGDPVERRGAATTAAGAVAVFAGADALRVHDVAAGVRAALVGRALRSARRGARRP